MKRGYYGSSSVVVVQCFSRKESARPLLERYVVHADVGRM